MIISSASTLTIDPYKAGIALGEGLESGAPEAVILFTSIHYASSSGVLEGLRDVLGKEVMILGSTGDGVMERDVCANHAAAALGLNSGNRVRWALGCGHGAGRDPRAALRESLRAVDAELGGRRASLTLLFSDYRTDADVIEQELQKHIPTPVVGGFAADDLKMRRSLVYVGDEVMEDSVGMLAMAGDVDFSIGVVRSLVPVGRPGVVTKVRKEQVIEIDGIPAWLFMEREMGKPMLYSDRGQIVFRLERPRDHGHCSLRALYVDPAVSREILTTFGRIRKGETVQLCSASPEHIMASMKSAAENPVRELAGGLVINCAGRKYITGNDPAREFGILKQRWPARTPVCGFASFGEFAPIARGDGYTPTMFHNMTSVYLEFGT